VNTKRIIQRTIFITLTLAACSGLVVLLVAAIGKKNHDNCRDYLINIKGPQNDLFIDEKDVTQLLTKATRGKVKGEAIVSFNLRQLEQTLRDNVWIKNAELYFDNHDVLHVSVVEREPIARIFTEKGKSFYIDSTMRQIPLSDKMSARVPVFTNFPDKIRLSEKDSSILKDIRKTASFILNDPFWMGQVEQIDISDCGFKCWSFEMTPTIGNHVVKLGNADNIERKFHRLLVFYQQVMNKTGFNKYDVVDVQFEGQVIGSKRQRTKVDSLQMEKNIQKLLRESQQMETDDQNITLEKPNFHLEQQAASQTSAVETQMNANPKPLSSNPKLVNVNSKPMKTDQKSNTEPKLIKQPKAVMQR
jgi:cell division protein FtsQ